MSNAFQNTFNQYYAHAMAEGITEKALVEKTFIDLITIAFRLYATDPDTMTPETREVMDRWRPIMDWILEDATSQIKRLL